MARRKKRVYKRFPHKYSATIIGVSSSIDKNYFREVGERARYRPREDHLLKKFGVHQVPDEGTTYTINNERRKALGKSFSIYHSSKEDVEDYRKEMQENFVPERRIRLINRKANIVYLVWNSEYTRFFFLRKVFSVIVTSISYPSRERAMQVFNTNKITWVHRHSDHSSASPQASP